MMNKIVKVILLYLIITRFIFGINPTSESWNEIVVSEIRFAFSHPNPCSICLYFLSLLVISISSSSSSITTAWFILWPSCMAQAFSGYFSFLIVCHGIKNRIKRRIFCLMMTEDDDKIGNLLFFLCCLRLCDTSGE